MSDDTPSRELATVTHLPARVLDAELVTPEAWAELMSQRGQAMARRAAWRQDGVTVIRVTRNAVTHPHTVTAARATARHGAYVVVGASELAKRLWQAKTNSVSHRMVRHAMAAGNLEEVREWYDRGQKEKQYRHGRVMDWLRAPVEMIQALTWAVLGGTGLLVVLGLVSAAYSGNVADVLGPIKGAIWLVASLIWIVTVVAAFLPLAVATFVVAGCWMVGRNAGRIPSWLATSDGDVDVQIDETTIASALAALRIQQITVYLKEGMALQFLTTPRVDGRGTHCVVRLPRGVPATTIARRRADLATGLYRLAKEVWPTTGDEAGILDLWIADKGALAEGAGPYPLLTEGATDVFKGVPFGKHLRGTPMVAPLLERNTLCGGMPGQGKSSAARAIMAGAALDPTAELRIWVPDSNFDFEAFAPRCSRYVMGAEDEKIGDILTDLRELKAEVQARGELLIRHETPNVTRDLANRNIGLHPLFCLLEEAHVAIGHPEHGKEIGQLVIDIVRLGRKRAIHLLVSTQAPTRDSIPRDVTRNCSNGIAFAVGDHIANDALLGQGAYAGGHRATELIPGADRGTAVVKGFTGERSDIVQVYFISIDKEGPGGDQITPIIARAMDLIAHRGRGMPGRHWTRTEVVERDLLEDVAEALGDEAKVNDTDMVARLRLLAPDYEPYEALNGIQLRKLLGDLGVAVQYSGGYYPVRAARVRKALGERQ